MELEYVLGLVRGSERLLIVLFGGISLILGWNLFRVGVVTEQVAELEKGDLSVKLQKVGPGIFFALFGAVILVSATMNALLFPHKNSTDSNDDSGGSIRYVNKNKEEIRRSVQALNTIKAYLEQEEVEDKRVEKPQLWRAVNVLEATRKDLIKDGVGEKTYKLWRKHRNDNRALIENEQILSALEDVEKWNQIIITK